MENLLFHSAVPGSVKLLPPGTAILNRTMPEPQARSRWKSQSPPTSLPVSRIPTIPSTRLIRFPQDPSVIHLARHFASGLNRPSSTQSFRFPSDPCAYLSSTWNARNEWRISCSAPPFQVASNCFHLAHPSLIGLCLSYQPVPGGSHSLHRSLSLSLASPPSIPSIHPHHPAHPLSAKSVRHPPGTLFCIRPEPSVIDPVLPLSICPRAYLSSTWNARNEWRSPVPPRRSR